MTETAASAPAATGPHKGLLARVIGVFVSPRATYADVAARPRWFGVLAVSCIVIAGAYFVLLSTEVGKQAAFDQQTQIVESFGVKLNDEALQRMEAGIERARFTTPISQLIAVPVVLLIFAGILLGIFNALLGGDATFKQVYAILAHSTVIGASQAAFAVPINYLRETMSSPTTLGVFVPFLEEKSFLALLLGMIDLFQVWGTLSIAIGLGVLYKRKTGPIAVGLFVVYGVIVVTIAAIRSALS